LSKRVLITGGLGYIGSHICVKLLSQGVDVGVVDNLSNSQISVLEKISTLAGREAEHWNLDVRNTAELLQVFHSFEPDSVIHMAGLKSVSESERIFQRSISLVILTAWIPY